VTVNGCSTTDSVEVEQSTIVVMAEVTDECIDNIYTLEVSDVDGSFEPATASYSWTGPNGFTASTQSAVPVDLGTYTVTVTTADGCVGTASLEVTATQCLIQRGISPNNDGENDFFDLTTMDVEQLSIFNRYGQEVYSRSNYTNQWVGQTDSGDELPTGTYFYMIERANGEQITGWIYINREE
jgi:gliding motility-associated-like protein